MANLKFQNMESAICDLKFRVLARTCCSRFAPRSLFNCGIRVEGRNTAALPCCLDGVQTELFAATIDEINPYADFSIDSQFWMVEILIGHVSPVAFPS
jgi:hypothetical protein